MRRAERDLVDLEVVEQVALLQAGYLSSVELTEAYLERIRRLNGPYETYGDNGLYNAFVRVDEDARAGRGARRRRAPRGGPPRRTPSARRGCAASRWASRTRSGREGYRQLNGTTAFEGNVALRHSTPVARLREQGVVTLGITVCSAFSGSIAGTFSGNAWNLDYVPGGSSQGSGRRADRPARVGGAGGGDGRLDHLPGCLQRRVVDQAVARDSARRRASCRSRRATT